MENTINTINDFVAKIKESQNLVLGALNRIESTVRMYELTQNNLLDLDNKLNRHFHYQKESLFNLIEMIAGEKIKQDKIIEFLKIDLNEIKITAITFFDDYLYNVTDGKLGMFPKSFIEFSRRINERISIEKKFLFPLVDNYLKTIQI